MLRQKLSRAVDEFARRIVKVPTEASAFESRFSLIDVHNGLNWMLRQKLSRAVDEFARRIVKVPTEASAFESRFSLIDVHNGF